MLHNFAARKQLNLNLSQTLQNDFKVRIYYSVLVSLLLQTNHLKESKITSIGILMHKCVKKLENDHQSCCTISQKLDTTHYKNLICFKFHSLMEYMKYMLYVTVGKVPRYPCWCLLFVSLLL